MQSLLPEAVERPVRTSEGKFYSDSFKDIENDIDMAKAVSKEIGIPIEFKPIDWASKETELESGRIDCIWNGFTMTPERQKALAFTKPYMDNVQVYVVLADSAVQKAEELKGKKLSIRFWIVMKI